MNQVIKTFIGLFFIFFLTFLGIGIVSASIQVLQAKEFKENTILQIENSDFNANVMNQSITQAKENGYAMKITLYKADGSFESHENPDVDLAATDVVKMAEVILQYQYKIAFLGIQQNHAVQGYAR